MGLPSAESWEDPSSSRQFPHPSLSSSGCSTSPSPPWRLTGLSTLASKKNRPLLSLFSTNLVLPLSVPAPSLLLFKSQVRSSQSVLWERVRRAAESAGKPGCAVTSSTPRQVSGLLPLTPWRI